MKKILNSLLMLVMIMGCVYSIHGTDVSNWHEFLGDGNVIQTKTPTTENETVISWSYDFTSGWDSLSDPIIVNDQLFVATGTQSQLLKLDLDGNMISQMTLASSLGYNVNIAYGDGMIFVPLGDGRVQAVDAATMTSLWISEAVEGALQGRFTYYDGYLYFGSFSTNYITSNGSFYALEVKDEEPANPQETKAFTWSHASKNDTGGYNWSKAAIYKNIVYIAGLDGSVYAYHAKTGNLLGEHVVGESISSALNIVGNQLYFTTKLGKIYKISLNEDGTFSTVMSQSLDTKATTSSTSTPTISNGRVYVGGGNGYGEKGFISVLDSQTLKIIYRIETPNDVQASLLVTTAYHGKAVAYFTMNNKPGGLYALVDDIEHNTGAIEAIYTPTGEADNYCMSSAIADHYGNLYHTNDSGFLTKLSKTADITLENNGIKVTGNFANDVQLDVKQINQGEQVQSLLTTHDEFSKLTMFDLNLFNTEGAVEPNDEVLVTLPIPTDYASDRLKLFYLDSTLTVSEIDFQIINEQIQFRTNHFSIYVLAELKEEKTNEEVEEEIQPIAPQPNIPQVPPTGDNTGTTLYIVVAGVAVVGIIALVVLNRKKK